MSTIGSKTTYTGAAGTTFSWIFSSEFGIAAGVLIGILGFALNWYYSRKRDQREQAVHEVLMNFKDNMEANKFMKIHGSLNDGK